MKRGQQRESIQYSAICIPEDNYMVDLSSRVKEIASAENNQIFLDFLGKLRSNYLKRQKRKSYKTFQSVILAGVMDVKHLKSLPGTASRIPSLGCRCMDWSKMTIIP